MLLYKHYRSGKVVEVVTVARHTETEEELIIYKDFPKSEDDIIRTWARPASIFYSDVNGHTRFEAVNGVEEIFTEKEIELMKECINNTDSCSDRVIRINADYYRKELEAIEG